MKLKSARESASSTFGLGPSCLSSPCKARFSVKTPDLKDEGALEETWAPHFSVCLPYIL